MSGERQQPLGGVDGARAEGRLIEVGRECAGPEGHSGARPSANSVRGVTAWLRRHWPLLRRILIGGFIVAVAGLLALAAFRVDWVQVGQAAASLPPASLAVAYALTFAGYLAYASFDQLGRCYTGHTLSRLRTLCIACTSYAFNLNLGGSIGGLGLRLRLYTRSGVSPADAARVFVFAVSTNWIGYCLVSGCLFASGYIALPETWPLSDTGLRIGGGVAIVAVVAYVLFCFLARRREWSVRGHTIVLPTGALALAQAGAAAVHWLLMGGVLYVLLQHQASYAMALGAVLLSAVIGLLIRVPAGLGVLEATVIALLASAELPRSDALAATLVFRAVYYLTPLFVAGVWYLVHEADIGNRQGEGS